MELAYSIGNLIIGILIALVGFGKINPLHKETKEKQAEFYERWGFYFKAGGIAVALVGFLRLYGILN